MEKKAKKTGFVDKTKNCWFIAIFLLTLILPIYGWALDAGITLNGVAAPPEEVAATLQNCSDGTYQAYLNAKWEAEFPGRSFFLRFRNQLLYSVFQVSPNSNVVIGKDGYLYEPGAIFFEIQVYPPSPEEYFETLGRNLQQLNQLLENSGKELYVFITPTKPHFKKDCIPSRYSFLNNEALFSYTDYSKLVETLNTYGINFYDAIDFIEKNLAANVLNAPVFYKSGWHWSHPWGESAAAEFLDYMNSYSKYDLSSLEVREKPCSEPAPPDADLYSTLNLLLEPKEQWYSTEIIIKREGSDHPNIFLRGCSFMGQSLNKVISSGVFGKDVHFENNYYATNRYSTIDFISSFRAYDELDINMLMGQSDILVLEVNESAIHDMSYGFIDYLLEHPDYLDKDY